MTFFKAVFFVFICFLSGCFLQPPSDDKFSENQVIVKDALGTLNMSWPNNSQWRKIHLQRIEPEFKDVSVTLYLSKESGIHVSDGVLYFTGLRGEKQLAFEDGCELGVSLEIIVEDYVDEYDLLCSLNRYVLRAKANNCLGALSEDGFFIEQTFSFLDQPGEYMKWIQITVHFFNLNGVSPNASFFKPFCLGDEITIERQGVAL